MVVSKDDVTIQSHLKSCSVEAGQPKICLIDKESYKNPFKISVEIQLNIREIISIAEEGKSISVQLLMHSNWKDSGLTRSNATIM